MVGDLFDVFVVDSADPSPQGHQKLAGVLAKRHGVPVAVVVRGIADKSLRVGSALERGQADEIARQLHAVGAVTVIRPAQASGRDRTPATPGMGLAPPTVSSINVPTAVSPQHPFSAPGQGGGRLAPLSAGPPTVGSGQPGFGPGAHMTPTSSLGPLGTPPGGPTPTNPMLPALSGPLVTTGTFSSFSSPPLTPTGQHPLRALEERTPTNPTPYRTGSFKPADPAHTTPVGRDPFGAPQPKSDPRLELDLGAHPGDAPRRLGSTSLPGASALEIGRMTASSSTSGLSVEEEGGNLYSVRCPKHSLFYDKRKFSGCRKCLEPARTRAHTMEHQRPSDFRITGLRGNAVKRAFLGLFIALLVGLLPAAVHAFRIGAAPVMRVRAEQEELSHRAGTEEVLRRFDELDEEAIALRHHAMRDTFGIWLAVSGLALAVWYKIT